MRYVQPLTVGRLPEGTDWVAYLRHWTLNRMFARFN